jgi:hypothetical protein
VPRSSPKSTIAILSRSSQFFTRTEALLSFHRRLGGDRGENSSRRALSFEDRNFCNGTVVANNVAKRRSNKGIMSRRFALPGFDSLSAFLTDKSIKVNTFLRLGHIKILGYQDVPKLND